jgi:hypothetical protein
MSSPASRGWNPLVCLHQAAPQPSLPVAFDSGPSHAGAGARNRAMSDRICILFGMNVLSLAGFLVMGLSLTLHRTGNAGSPLSIGLMCAGTALVFFGLFSAASSN